MKKAAKIDLMLFRAYPHDCFVRLCLSDVKTFAAFLRYCGKVAPINLLDLNSLCCLNSATVDGKLEERIGDLRFSARFKQGGQPVEVFIFLEHQSAPDPHIPFRLLEYIVDAYRQFLADLRNGDKNRVNYGRFPYPLAIILYNGAKPWKGALRMRDLICQTDGVDSAVLDFPIHLIDVARLSLENDIDDPALRILLEALQAAAQGRMKTRYESIAETFAYLKGDLRAQYLLDGFAHYAGSLCRPKRWLEIARKMMCRLFGDKEGNAMADTIIDEMLAKGEAKGEAKGKAEGKAEGKIESILSVLGVRFGSVPKPVAKAVEKCTDVEKLEKLVVAAVTCGDMKDFKRKLGL